MRKLSEVGRGLVICILVAMLLIPSVALGAGTATATKQDITISGYIQRKVITISWTDDTTGTTLAINPSTYGIAGWFLYSAETNPGTTAPTDDYDITLVDADGVDLAGGLLLNRDTATTELVLVGASSHGYPVIRSTFTFTLSGNSVNNATGTLILTFTAQ